MKKTTFSLLFYLKRTKPLKDGTYPIFVRISVCGQRNEFSIHYSIEESEWDSRKGKVLASNKRSREINSYMETVKVNVHLKKRELEEEGKEVTAQSLRDNYLGLADSDKTILKIFQEHNDKIKELKNIDFSPGTIERYNTAKKHLGDFMKLRYKRNDMTLSEINQMFISDFEFYLKITRKCCHNTATKYLKNLKKIIRIALANGWMKKDPFANIKFRLDEVDVDYLSEEELNILMEKEFNVERLQLTKDIYVFCCFTGLAFIDVKNLKYEDLEEKKGQLWIKKKRQKTKSWCSVPLLGPARNLMDKYRSHPICMLKQVVLPVTSNQKMNAYMKEIAALCEIQKNLTCHTARHTFATTVTLANQISIEVVSRMLGHSSINMTKKYARVVDDLINRDMEKIYGKYDAIMVN
jgi:site-specific recombinase XerD